MSDCDEGQQLVRPQGREPWMSTTGTEVCSGTEFGWSFELDSTELVAR